MSQINVNVNIIKNFCDYFKDNFSNTQFRAFTMIVYAMLKDYKRLSISSLTKGLPIDDTGSLKPYAKKRKGLL